MTNFWFSLLFSLSLSLDSLVAFFGYGAEGLKVSFSKLISSIFISILVLSLGLAIGYFLASVVELNIFKYISFALLMLIGLTKLFSELFKIWLDRKRDKDLHINLFNFKLIINICLNPIEADLNKDKILSFKEACLIGFVLSIDSFSAGIGLGGESAFPYLIIILSFVFELLLSFVGYKFGRKLSTNKKFNLSWLSGIILIVLAILKLV